MPNLNHLSRCGVMCLSPIVLYCSNNSDSRGQQLRIEDTKKWALGGFYWTNFLLSLSCYFEVNGNSLILFFFFQIPGTNSLLILNFFKYPVTGNSSIMILFKYSKSVVTKMSKYLLNTGYK